MDCKTAIEKMDGFREKSLSRRETLQIKKHLAECERCRSTLSRMEELDIGLGDVVRGVKPSKDFADRTVSKAKDLEIKPVRVSLAMWVPVAVAACLVLAVFAGFVLTRDTGPGKPISSEGAPSNLASTYPAGSAFVAGGDASVLPYQGATNVEVGWDFLENAPQLTVEVFPGRE